MEIKIKKTILCFSDYYLPGYKAGGPIKSISNLVNSLEDKFNFMIITRNHDLGAKESYENIVTDNWNIIGKAKVFYLSKKNLNILGIYKILNETSFDLIYFNSFFSLNFTILPLLILKFSISKQRPLLIAPRGEFSREAIRLKKFKKIIYISLFKMLNLYKYLSWQASSEFEKDDITRVLPFIEKNIHVAPDITFSTQLYKEDKIFIRELGPLRIIFLSRISPIKNLKFILNIFKKIETRIDFSIYGPKSNYTYWNECLNIINELPKNIKVNIFSEISNKVIHSTFKKYDLCVLPTLGENFCHVVYESLIAGTPMLVSDRTPWQENGSGGLKILPLVEKKWISFISDWSQFDDKTLLKKREESINYIKDFESKNTSIKLNSDLFYNLLI